MSDKHQPDIESCLRTNGWQIAHAIDVPGRAATLFSTTELQLSPAARALISALPAGVFGHQKVAIEASMRGDDVCLATSTASGKTLVFHIAAAELLSKNPDARVLALYPLKALGIEQQAKWSAALRRGRLNADVGRIDGGIAVGLRAKTIRSSRVLVATPDVVHAWLLPSAGTSEARRFLAGLSMVVVDEAHTYTGVFGSNAGFLFRRIEHACRLLGGGFRYVAASATMNNPGDHLRRLTGRDFVVIGPERDSSPRRASRVLLVTPPSGDILQALSSLLAHIAINTPHHFIAFFDSRKQTEYLAAMARRHMDKTVVAEDAEEIDFEQLRALQIQPYRAGYEEVDRAEIQARLTAGQLRGVVSTSALEMGIDIPHLSVGILYGVPPSATSFLQRIGRVGRHTDGTILIVNSGTVSTESVFRKPERLTSMPLSESTLYLDNPRIQYIHALCLARPGGEHDSCAGAAGRNEEGFDTEVPFPPRFIDLCRTERIGEIPVEFQSMKAQAGEDPSHAFPLRDVEMQFQVELNRGPGRRQLGSLSFGQLMREAYPGAVYYYQTQPFRVVRGNIFSRKVEVRPEKRYTTRPTMLPPLIFPNLTQGNVFSAHQRGELLVIECNLQVRESLAGYRERRGPNEIVISYPLNPSAGMFFDQPRFTRNYFTTGVVLDHPALDNTGVKWAQVAQILFEAFKMIVPFERADISFADDKHRKARGAVKQGRRFVAIHDQTYGSLHLTSALASSPTLEHVLDRAVEIAQHVARSELDRETAAAIRSIATSVSQPRVDIEMGTLGETAPSPSPIRQQVIVPGSRGLDIRRNNEEFEVEAVFFSPQIMGLAYRGKHLSEKGPNRKDVVIIVPVANIVEIPGESRLGNYDLETGRIEQ